MNIKEEIIEMKKEVSKIQEESLAMMVAKDYKKQNKRQFIIILILIACLMCSVGYTIYILNDIETKTIEIDDVDNIDNSNISNGDIKWEK